MTPNETIEGYAARFGLLSDAAVLSELAAVPPLADESDPCWDNEGYWDRVAFRYLAHWEVAAIRKLRAAVPLLLDRASFGDPGEIMRGLCHTLEAIEEPDWSELTERCVAALESVRSGTRLWAVHQLGRIRSPSSKEALKRAALDGVPMIRDSALEFLK